MLINILIFYYVFSVLFMIGYVDDKYEPTPTKILIYLSLVVVSPIMFPINIGYYIRKNS